MLAKFKWNQEEDYIAGCIDNAGYRIEERSPSAGRQGTDVLAYESEKYGPLPSGRRSQRHYKGARLDRCAGCGAETPSHPLHLHQAKRGRATRTVSGRRSANTTSSCRWKYAGTLGVGVGPRDGASVYS